MDLGELQRVFLGALDQPASHREGWVRERLAHAPELEAEVLALLQYSPDSRERTAIRIAPTGVLAASFEEMELPTRAAGDRVLDRYVIERSVGEGGFSRVYGGRDEITDAAVAIKLMRRPAGVEGERAEAEVSLQRYLMLPGVVRVVDDGVDGDALCLVTELVEGAPFPGPGGLAAPLLLSRVRQLLKILARLHEAGVLHNDLKPANVLVSSDGDLTLIDLGVAHDLVGSGGEACMWGTPAYVAPERASGGVPTVQADLFSVGVMVAETAGTEDDDLARLAEACTRTRPGDRPESCVAALGLLGERPSVALVGGVLEEILEGPERIHHVPERARALAERRAAAARHSPYEEVCDWVDHGWVSAVDGRVRISARQLSQLIRRPPPGAYDRRASSEAAFRNYLASFAGEAQQGLLDSAPDSSLPAIAMEIAEATRARAPAHALEVLVATGRYAAGRLDAKDEDDLLTALVESALAQSTIEGLHRAAYALRRASSEHAADLSKVLRSAVATVRGQGESASEILAEIGESASPDALRLVHAVRVLGAQARPIAEHRAVVQAAARWAATVDQPGLPAIVASWQGWLLYREGQFEKAARMHEQAAEASVVVEAAWRARLNSAAALMDAGLHEQAAAHAEACLLAGKEVLLGPVLEARAEANKRAAQYRQGLAEDLDPHLVEAVEQPGVHPRFAASILLTEAAIAWRLGHHHLATALAQRASERWLQAGARIPAILAEALAAAAVPKQGVLGIDPTELVRAPPAVRVQIVGLTAYAGAPLSDEDGESARRIGRGFSGQEWTRRREVCSLAEAIEWLDAP